MLDDYVAKELIKRERIVIENPDWLVVVPFWATWPFETMIISRNGNKRISDLTTQQINNLSITIKELTTKYDNLFNCSFPYSMGEFVIFWFFIFETIKNIQFRISWSTNRGFNKK